MTRCGAGACTTQEHFLQLIFGRTCRMTKKLAGMYSSISETSSPSLRNPPLQHGHLLSAGKCVLTLRRRWAGIARRLRSFFVGLGLPCCVDGVGAGK